MNWVPPSPEQREAEDIEMRRSDRRLARLAVNVLCGYVLMDGYQLWLVLQRVRGLKRAGTTDQELLDRLRP